MTKLIKEGVTIIFQDENDTSLERQRHNSEFDFTYYGVDVTIKLEDQRIFHGAYATLLDEVDTPFTRATLQTFVGDFNEGGGGIVAHGVVDYNDLTTQTTPIVIASGFVPSFLTNDGLGAFTNKTFVPPSIGETWNVITNEFDFSDLPLGSKLHYRLDFEITTSANNQPVITEIEVAIGGFPYTLNINRSEFKSIGTYQIAVSNWIYIGDSNTKDNPAKFKISSENPATVIVNGWALYYTLFE